VIDLTPTPLLKERGFELAKFAFWPLSFRRGVGVRSIAEDAPNPDFLLR
jgi:hypothetical protein